jgi:hypothetical protein
MLVCLALVAAAHEAAAEDDDPPSLGSRYFLGLRLGIASRDPETTRRMETWSAVSFGIPVGHARQLVIGHEWSEERIDDTPAYFDRSATFLGLRVTPWSPKRHAAPSPAPSPYIDIRALQLTMLAGKETCTSITYEMGERYESADHGLVFGVDAGYIPFQGADWGFGMEFTGRIARHEDGNEVAFGYGVVAYIMK